jgi:hypothetical protein
MDLITTKEDLTFDSGPQPVSTAAAWQTIGRIQSRGRKTLVSMIVGPQSTIGGLQVLQSAYPDDPNPVVIASGTGLNSVALADLSYVVPAPLSFPLAAGSVVQFHFQGDAAEIIFQAQTAGAAGGTIQLKGEFNKAAEDH